MTHIRQRFKHRIDCIDLALMAALAASLAVHLWSLMRYPAPFVDEAWNLSRAWAYLHTGKVFGPLDAGVMDRFEGYWTFFPWLHHFFLSLSIRLFGLNLFAGRIVSLIFGLLLLIAVWAIGRRAGGPTLGWVGALLTSLSWAFVYSAHMTRTDVVVSAFGFGAVALYLYNRPPRFWVSVLSGLLVGIAFEMHPEAVVFGPVVAAMYFGELRWAMFRAAHWWGFVAGVIAGLVFDIAIHILPHFETYVAVNSLGLTATYTPPIVSLDLLVLAQAFRDTGVVLIVLYQLMLVLVVWAVVVLAKRRAEGDKTLLVLGGAVALTFTLVMRRKGVHYAILFTPAVDLLVAAFLIDFARRPWQRTLGNYLRQVIVWGALSGTIAFNLSALRIEGLKAYQAAQDRINQSVRPGETIMAAQTYWLGLHDHAYYSWEQLVYYRHYAAGSTLTDALREFRPDIFIIDKQVGNYISDPKTDPPPYLWLPKTELEAFLTENATLVDEFDSGYYGNIRVYRIKWER